MAITFRTRILLLSALGAMVFAALLGRLAQLQIVRGEEYRLQAELRCQRPEQVPPRRGAIRDRYGRILADDRPSFRLWLVPAQFGSGKRGRRVQSLLPELSAARMMQMAESSGEKRQLELEVARRDLAAESELVKNLALLLQRSPLETAGAICGAILKPPPRSDADLVEPRACFDDVPFSAFLAVKQLKADPDTAALFAALEPRLSQTRHYPEAEDCGHITGYVGPLSADEYRRLRGGWEEEMLIPGEWALFHQRRLFFQVNDTERRILQPRQRRRQGRSERYVLYLANDLVGRGGVEEWYNQRLRGHHGERYLRLEKTEIGGRRLRQGISASDVRHGEDLTLTLDAGMQRRIRRLFVSELEKLNRERQSVYKGICILMDPHNGRIYALVSEPSFDPNAVRRDFAALMADPRQPLLNRAIAGQYPPGSVFKPIVALAALSEGRISAGTTFLCEGVERLGDHDFICMRRAVHGHLSVADALMVSCNIFFYHAGRALGSRALYTWAERLSLGRRTGIDLAGEAAGHLPREAFSGKGWALGHTYHLAIGQGPITVTPLQIAVATAAIANGGKVVRPHLIYDPAHPEYDEPMASLPVSPAALAAVRQGMWQVVQESRGTGKEARLPGLAIAGKTGSAEWRKGQPTHAWFACYAPADNPQVVCVILVPEGNFGGHTCAPIARRILALYFNLPEEEGMPEEEALG